MKLKFIAKTKAGEDYFKTMIGELDQEGYTFICISENPYTIESNNPKFIGKPTPDITKATALKIGYRHAFKQQGLEKKDYKVKFENDK